MATTEHTINDALALLLRKTRWAWRDPNVVTSENTGILRDNRKRPDILIKEAYVFPVVIETEVFPAMTVEDEAISRLGEHIRETGQPILSSIALRLPDRLREKQGTALQDELARANDLEMVLYTSDDQAVHTRWPDDGWLSGSIASLSILAQSASIPPYIIDLVTDQLIEGVSEAAGLLKSITRDYPGTVQKIGQALCQEAGEQTFRMASTILVNAFIFHEFLVGGDDKLTHVASIDQLRNSPNQLTKSSILAEWRKILEFNYWPIFDIARRILEVIPTADSYFFIQELAATADKLLQNRIMRSHDLTGTVFQRLIVDRKFLAAFYTIPASAALLVGLAITPEMLPSEKSWSNPEDVTALRVADFACGTGTLLSTAYRRMSQLHEIAGGDSRALHPQMMANVLVGCDVLPTATHLTVSMLSGIHPTIKYDQSSILTVAYGKQPNGAIALGSLDLLNSQGTFTILSITAKVAEANGEAEVETWRSLPTTRFDLVVMNPPFTSSTSHEGQSLTVPNPIFAAFGASAEEQKLMADAARRLTKDTSAHGNAGEASMFLVLGDRKLKDNGRLALVMPLSLMAGAAWENSRRMLAENYSNLILVSIAATGTKEMAFSADTGMGECLVLGHKSEIGSTRALFVILDKRPAYPLIGEKIAEQIHGLISNGKIRRLEDGPMGGTYLYFGGEVAGQILDAPLPTSGGWYIARIIDLSLAQTAYQIINEKCLWLPIMNKSNISEIPITTVGKIGKIGPINRDINGYTSTKEIRGPFDIYPARSNLVPTYPVLWAHDAKRERTMAFPADCEGVPRIGSDSEEQEWINQKMEYVWSTASHCHFNRDFRFNSQSTGMQFTPRKSIGGRAWTSIQLSSVELEKALVAWGNTTLGLLLRWWYSNKQQSGRGSVSKLALQTLPILNVTALTPAQLAEAVNIFDSMKDQEMLPLHQIDQDPVRKELDERFARDVLGMSESVLGEGGSLEILRIKLSREPSIRGRK